MLAQARAVTSALALPKIALDDSAVRGSRYTALDAWRGLAALSVVYGHQTAGRVGASLFIAFYLAVDFFFVLSGFVLAHRYWEELVRDRKPFFSVVIARFARLYPAHVFVLFALLIGFGIEAIPAYRAGTPMLAAWSEAIPPFPGGPGLSTFILNLLLLQNVGLTPTGLTWNVPSWSISVEFVGSLAVLGLVAICASPECASRWSLSRAPATVSSWRSRTAASTQRMKRSGTSSISVWLALLRVSRQV